MKHTFTQILLFFFFTFWLSPIIAQNIIWSEDFSSGQIPTGWINVDAAGQVMMPWEWETSGIYFPGQPSFSAPTVTNGFVMFDSDKAGFLPTGHNAQLTTNAIDCSNQSTVIARFSNQYSYASPNAQASLGVSTDNINFTYFPILTNIQAYDLSKSEQLSNVDISSVAANQAVIYLRFRWIGNYEYTWRIDDVILLDAFVRHNLAIEDYSLPNAHQIPLEQIDTFFFQANIENLGSQSQTNVQLTAEITDFNNQIIFAETVNLNTIPGNTNGNTVVFNTYLIPSANLQSGEYTVSYSLIQDSIDFDSRDNQKDFGFVISDTTFAIDNGKGLSPFAGGSGVQAAGSYGVANYYYVPNDGSKATSVAFAVNNPFSLAGELVDIYLYQVDINNDGNLDDDGNGFINSDDFNSNLKGFFQYTFTGFETSNNLITVPLDNFMISGEEIPLVQNGSYLVVFKYFGNELLLITTSEKIPYSNLNTIGINTANDQWILGGLPTKGLAVLRLNIQALGTATTYILPESSVKIFPNPASDYLNISVNLENLNEYLDIMLTDMNGRIVIQDYQSNIWQQSFNYNIKSLSSGIYFLIIKTEKGQLTKKIIIE
jgi:hypothetical protein